ARWTASIRFGIAIAARIPMIATTISSSMRVKPRSLRRTLPPGPGTQNGKADTKRTEIDKLLDLGNLLKEFPPSTMARLTRFCQGRDKECHATACGIVSC